MSKSNRNPAWLTKELFPFKSRLLEVDGNSIHYVDEGSGPTLLLLHGNASYSFLYREIIRRLSPSFRCLALDYPGFGLSNARPGYGYTPREHSFVVEKFADAMQLRDVRLMVHDWGGPIGLGWAIRKPELLHSLIIGNSWAWPAEKGTALMKYARIAGSPIGQFLIRHLNIFVRFMNPLGSNRKFTQSEKAALWGPFSTVRSRQPMAILPKEILRSREYLSNVEAGLARLRQKPALLLWADNDIGFGETERIRFEHLLPASSTNILHGAKHFFQEDAPAEVAEAILRFENRRRQLC